MDKKGFSLTELVVVIAVIGIIAGFAIPSTITLGRRFVDQEANNVVADLKDLREFAIEKGAEVIITRTGDNSFQAFIDYPGPNQDVVINYTYKRIVFAPLSRVNPLPDETGSPEPDGFTFPNNEIHILRYGSLVNPGAIFMRDKGGKQGFAISILQSGRIKLWKWAGGWR